MAGYATIKKRQRSNQSGIDCTHTAQKYPATSFCVETYFPKKVEFTQGSQEWMFSVCVCVEGGGGGTGDLKNMFHMHTKITFSFTHATSSLPFPEFGQVCKIPDRYIVEQDYRCNETFSDLPTQRVSTLLNVLVYCHPTIPLDQILDAPLNFPQN